MGRSPQPTANTPNPEVGLAPTPSAPPPDRRAHHRSEGGRHWAPALRGPQDLHPQRQRSDGPEQPTAATNATSTGPSGPRPAAPVCPALAADQTALNANTHGREARTSGAFDLGKPSPPNLYRRKNQLKRETTNSTSYQCVVTTFLPFQMRREFVCGRGRFRRVVTGERLGSVG